MKKPIGNINRQNNIPRVVPGEEREPIMKMKLLAKTLICSALISFTVTGCAQKFDTEAYKDSVQKFIDDVDELNETVLSMAAYELNYWKAMNNIGGNIDFDEFSGKAYDNLYEKEGIDKASVDADYESVCTQYKEIFAPDTDDKEITAISEKVDDYFETFNSIYNLVNSPSGSLTNFANDLVEKNDDMEDISSSLEVLLKD